MRKRHERYTNFLFTSLTFPFMLCTLCAVSLPASQPASQSAKLRLCHNRWGHNKFGYVANYSRETLEWINLTAAPPASTTSRVTLCAQLYSTRCLMFYLPLLGHLPRPCLADIAWDCVHQLVINHTILPLRHGPQLLLSTLCASICVCVCVYRVVNACVCVCVEITVHIYQQTIAALSCDHSAYT